MAHKSAIIGSVVERKPTSSFSTPKAAVTKTGFPTVQHISKSAFARNRDDLRRPVSRPVHPASSEPADWRHQISKENEERVADMTEEQREEEIRQIQERFGTSIGDVLKRARLARETRSVTEETINAGSIPVISEPRTSNERGEPYQLCSRSSRFTYLINSTISPSFCK
jgi:hypothetical protein